MRISILLIAVLPLAGCSTNTYNTYQAANVAPRAEAPADVAAIDALLKDVYAVISGPAGQPRDFDRMRSLFTPDARLSSITSNGIVGGTVDDYIARSGDFLVERGFAERQLSRRIEVWGDLAHAWSSYEGNFTRPDGTPGSVSGINSFQFARIDGVWKVQSIFWQATGPDRALPSDMSGE